MHCVKHWFNPFITTLIFLLAFLMMLQVLRYMVSLADASKTLTVNQWAHLSFSVDFPARNSHDEVPLPLIRGILLVEYLFYSYVQCAMIFSSASKASTIPQWAHLSFFADLLAGNSCSRFLPLIRVHHTFVRHWRNWSLRMELLNLILS